MTGMTRAYKYNTHIYKYNIDTYTSFSTRLVLCLLVICQDEITDKEAQYHITCLHCILVEDIQEMAHQ